MNTSSKHIVLIAGEASGDMHAAELVKEIHKIDPSITFSGLGGPRMHNAGVKIYQDLTKIAVVGFWEIVKKYPLFKKAFDLILRKIKETNAAAVILVDYPGFNLRIAKKLKNTNTKVIYYISPQVWAWKQKRVELIRKYVDKMLVLFKFEKDFYLNHDMQVDFVGHPLVDTIQLSKPRELLLKETGLKEYQLTIGLLPGSRENEVQKLLPIMMESAKILNEQYPMLQFLLIKAPTIQKDFLKKFMKGFKLPLEILEENHYDGINACDVCMVASGTATLETALLKKPMVIIYKTSFLTWVLAKLFIKIPDIGLVNVVAQKRIVPECIQHTASPKLIAEEVKNIFTDEIRIAKIKEELLEVREALGEKGASARAAQEIINYCISLS